MSAPFTALHNTDYHRNAIVNKHNLTDNTINRHHGTYRHYYTYNTRETVDDVQLKLHVFTNLSEDNSISADHTWTPRAHRTATLTTS